MFAREIWSKVETIHAVTYFAEESIHAARTAGLRGFWMGYFGFRASPLGPVTSGVVEAVFANFEPGMVGRSVPDVWSFANPSVLIAVRAQAAAAALRRLSPSVEGVAIQVNDSLEGVIACATSIGRPLFAANRGISRFDDPVERLWQNCTTLREHRGDGHVAALAAAGVEGCEAHILIAAESGLDPEVFFEHRGWSGEQQNDARTRLIERGLIVDGSLTSEGQALRVQIEATTDALAAEPYELALSAERRDDVLSQLVQVSAEIVGTDTIPFPNPMALPHPDGANG